MKHHPEQAKHLHRTTTVLAAMLFLSHCFAQYDCENFPAVSISYVIPKTIAVGIDYFTEMGLTGGIGAGYTPAKTYQVKQGENTFDSTGNQFDIFAYVGYRLLRIDYSVSVFLNAGYVYGDKWGASPVISTKVLFPIGSNAFSVEPFYILGRGFSSKISAHFRL